MLTPEAIVAYVEGRPHRRATFKQMVKELHVRGGQRQLLKSTLAMLVQRRRLAERRHFYEAVGGEARALKPEAHGKGGTRPQGSRRLPPSGPGGAVPGEITGRLSLHRDGYGFVIPDTPAEMAEGDIFIPPPAVGAAMHGDVVAVKAMRKRDDGRREGRILRVVRRAHRTVVGIFHRGSYRNYVQPIDDRLRTPIVIPGGAERPTAQEGEDAHRVLGREARAVAAMRRAQPEKLEDLDGLVVDVAIATYASDTSDATGRVIEVLGRRDDFGVDVEIVIRKFHLPHRYPTEVLDEAGALPATLPAEALAGRRDFRHLPIVTIDGESARDFDDAVYVEATKGGGFALQVHIADVSHYVTPGTALDREARLRGTSVYFPDRAVPMLPPRLSTDICSLRPHEDRLVMSCLMEIDAEGRVTGYEVAPGVIRSAARLTYTQVNAVLTGDSAARETFAGLTPMLERMSDLQQALYARRRKRGSIDFDLPEPEITFDEFGLMRSIVKSERNQAHRLIEEFMLAAAETVARHLEAAGAVSVYRIHEKPDLKKVADFEKLASAFGYTLGTGPLPIKTVRQRVNGRWRETEVPLEGKFNIRPQHYQKLSDKLAGKAEERILSYLMLRSLKQARYSTQNQGHFALATPSYTHFTSPIRRYPDLMVHRILKGLLPGPQAADRPPKTAEAMERKQAEVEMQCREASEAERRADDAERELMDWKKIRFMETRMGVVFQALILHVTRQGVYVELTDLFIEGFIDAARLGDEPFQYREATHEWVGVETERSYKLGGRLEVIIERIDSIRQQIQFIPAAEAEPPKQHEKSRKRGQNVKRGRAERAARGPVR